MRTARFLLRLALLITCVALSAPTFAGGRGGGGPHRHAPSVSYHHGGGGWHGGYHGGHVYYRPTRYYGGWGWYGYWGYPLYWNSTYYYRNQNGAVDLNVSPKHAQVYLDGGLVGKTGQYDGWPQYLWLPPGNHELIFHLDGYQTVRQEVKVVAGIVQRTHLDLVPGQATAVAELSVPHQRREQERRDLYDRYAKDRPRVLAPSDAPSADAVPAPTGDAPVDSAVLVVDIDPSDAVVYLDGRLIGSASSLAAQGGNLTVAAGAHTLEVIRPGYANYVTTVDAVPGKSLAVSIRLNRN